MSSDIWHYHHQQAGSFGVGGGGKRSRSVLAMPNHQGESSRRSPAGAQLSSSNSNNSSSSVTASRRPTYGGSVSQQQPQQIEDNSMRLAEEANSELYSTAAAATVAPANSQQANGGAKHAGPMGIFFKVWSLVKGEFSICVCVYFFSRSFESKQELLSSSSNFFTNFFGRSIEPTAACNICSHQGTASAAPTATPTDAKWRSQLAPADAPKQRRISDGHSAGQALSARRKSASRHVGSLTGLKFEQHSSSNYRGRNHNHNHDDARQLHEQRREQHN